MQIDVEIRLSWQGPHNLVSPASRESFAPPAEGGVYLWTIETERQHRISYVGEAGDLRKRHYEHVFSTLGGRYCLYDADQLARGRPPVAAYKPSYWALFTQFLNDFERFSKLAFGNLMAYRFWWATVGKERTVRQAVESALIQAARQNGDPLQNDRVSLLPANCGPVTIVSSFSSDTTVPAIAERLTYGAKAVAL